MKPVKLFHHPVYLLDIFKKISGNKNVDIIFDKRNFILSTDVRKETKNMAKNCFIYFRNNNN